ncbi:mycofactocin precursor MftA [Streptomyces sp. YKOK-I1]
MNELRSAPSEEAVTTTGTSTGTETGTEADQFAATAPLIEAEDLLEEISIDGMCGVY